MKKTFLRLIGVIGSLLFLPIFSFTFVEPQMIEKTAKSFIEWKLNKSVNDKIDAFNFKSTLTKSNILKKALNEKALKKIQEIDKNLEATKKHLKAGTPTLIAEQMAKMRDLSCECRKQWEERLQKSLEMKVFNLEKAKQKLIDFSQAKYMDIVKNLTFDIRVLLIETPKLLFWMSL